MVYFYRSTEFMKDQVTLIQEISSRFVSDILDDGQIGVIDSFQDIAGEVVGQTHFGNKVPNYNINIKPLCFSPLRNRLKIPLAIHKFNLSYISYTWKLNALLLLNHVS